MLKAEDECGGSGGWARVCDSCRSAPASVYCRADSAYLCGGCDSDIHSANPLARRHHRVGISDAAAMGVGPADGFFGQDEDETVGDNEDEAATWLLLNPVKSAAAAAAANQNQGNGFLFGGEVDDYLNFVEFNTCGEDHEFGDQYGQPQPYNGPDSIVPVRFEVKDYQQQQLNYQLSSENDASKAEYNSYNGFISHSVSVSSLEVGVVPESTASDMSISNARPSKGTIDLFSGPAVQMPVQLTPMDREARVLRYLEKKKTRKFEKTIRYASRKAYAETRPRIKGRFAKRTEVEVDRNFSNPLMAETGYGIVPSL